MFIRQLKEIYCRTQVVTKNILKLNILGYIKEPEGVDFVIQNQPLTDKDREEISKFIAEWKAKHKVKQSIKRKRKQLA